MDIDIHRHTCALVRPGILKQRDVSPTILEWVNQRLQEDIRLDEWQGKSCRKARLPSTISSALVYSCHSKGREWFLEKSHPQKSGVISHFFSRADVPCFLPNKVQMV